MYRIILKFSKGSSINDVKAMLGERVTDFVTTVRLSTKMREGVKNFISRVASFLDYP